MKVAKAYGMIHPGAGDTSAVRAVFIIYPEGNLRSMLYYPMSNGRQVNEILRLVKALQISSKMLLQLLKTGIQAIKLLFLQLKLKKIPKQDLKMVMNILIGISVKKSLTKT